MILNLGVQKYDIFLKRMYIYIAYMNINIDYRKRTRMNIDYMKCIYMNAYHKGKRNMFQYPCFKDG